MATKRPDKEIIYHYQYGDDSFWDQTPIGDILHYCYSRDQFIRGIVMIMSEGMEQGKKGIRPIALVGNWKKNEQVSRYRDGTPKLSYHAGMILNPTAGSVFRPAIENIYEYPKFSSNKHSIDPTKMPALDLCLPPMSEEEQKDAKHYKLAKWINNRLSGKVDSKVLNEIKMKIEAEGY